MIDDAVRLLQQCSDREFARTRGLYPVSLRPGASQAEVDDLIQRSLEEFEISVPPDLIALLQVSNGFQADNFYLHGAGDIVASTLDRDYDEEALFLGSDGPSDLVFDIADDGYHFVNIGRLDERFESYPTLEALLHRVIRGFPGRA